MMTSKKSLTSFEQFLYRRRYSVRTISSYTSALEMLFNFFSDVAPTDLTFQQVSDYVSYLLTRKKAALATVQLQLAAFDLYFSAFLNKDYDIQSLKIPRIARSIPPILSQDEILRLLQAIYPNSKYHILLSLIYSAGLDISQALRIKLGDISLKEKRIKVRNSNGDIVRVAILADKLVAPLQRYLIIYSPEKWLFEGSDSGSPLSASNLQRAFKKAIRLAKIEKKVSIRTLKYSYVKHVESYGVPLTVVLEEIGNINSASLLFYSQMGLEKTSISFSPLDRILHESEGVPLDVNVLERSFSQIENEDEKTYLLEAIKCLNARAPRATVVFAWNAAIRNIQNRCLQLDQKLMNEAIKKHYPKATKVESIEDFENVRERIVLETSCTLKIFDNREKNVLVGCLDLRNQCGHPGSYMPDNLRVAAFLEDLYKVVFSKPSPSHSKIAIHLGKDTEDDLPF